GGVLRPARLGDDSAAGTRGLAHGDVVPRAPACLTVLPRRRADSRVVSHPDMTDEEKLMSMRGNNPHFSHATVFHELNPGHHLQGFMAARYNAHRRLFATPFWSEGQSLYWEMFLWDHGFQQSPEDRLGALFWRMHRSARIIFSLSFHLGKMTPERAIAFLVDSVDFERANAEAE